MFTSTDERIQESSYLISQELRHGLVTSNTKHFIHDLLTHHAGVLYLTHKEI